MAKKKLSFEEAVAKIESIVETLENEEVSLEKSIALYKEGLTLSAVCQEKLAQAEVEITLLQRELSGELKETVFTLEEEK